MARIQDMVRCNTTLQHNGGENKTGTWLHPLYRLALSLPLFLQDASTHPQVSPEAF